MKIVLGRPQGSPLQPDICVVSTAESRHHNKCFSPSGKGGRKGRPYIYRSPFTVICHLSTVNYFQDKIR
ncbi:hypothetical protein ISS30_01065 [bacterium]|nr:hypothetical protein [bacterium]